jgi:hypothetical protein
VSFDQAGDSRQNFVQGCAEKDHLQRIKHRIGGQGLRKGWWCWKRFRLSVALAFAIKHPRSGKSQQYRTTVVQHFLTSDMP